MHPHVSSPMHTIIASARSMCLCVQIYVVLQSVSLDKVSVNEGHPNHMHDTTCMDYTAVTLHVYRPYMVAVHSFKDWSM